MMHRLMFLPLVLVFGLGMFAQWDRATSAERQADGWKDVSMKQEAAMRDLRTAMNELMAADTRLKQASDRLQAACASR
jgi:hypothetical protein